MIRMHHALHNKWTTWYNGIPHWGDLNTRKVIAILSSKCHMTITRLFILIINNTSRQHIKTLLSYFPISSLMLTLFHQCFNYKTSQQSLWMSFTLAADARVLSSSFFHQSKRKLSTTRRNHGESFTPPSPASAFLKSSFNCSLLTYITSATSSGFGCKLTSRTRNNK